MLNRTGGTNLEEKQTSSHIMLIDGMALLFRAFYATSITGQFMINSKGIPTNGIHGFIKHLFTAVSSFKPSHLAVCWDMGSKTFRTELFADYILVSPDIVVKHFQVLPDEVSDHAPLLVEFL